MHKAKMLILIFCTMVSTMSYTVIPNEESLSDRLEVLFNEKGCDLAIYHFYITQLMGKKEDWENLYRGKSCLKNEVNNCGDQF